MTIKVYPSHLEGLPIETIEWTGTLAGFFTSKGIDYTKKDPQPIAVTVNGEWLPLDEWASRHLESSDEVKVCLNTQYGGVFKGLGNIIGGVLGFAFGWLLPSNKSASYGSPDQGKRLETFQAKANQARLGDAVPEIAGRFRRFPDYLTPPRRYFSSPREQRLEFLACVGVGSYEINENDVKVGDTPFSDLGESGGFQIFEPGVDVSVDSAHEHWHTVEEVGGTSSGTAGLELTTDSSDRVTNDPSSYYFNNRTVRRNSGDFPTGWGPGTVVTIAYPRTYTVSVDIVDGVYRNRFTGFFGHTSLSGDFFGPDWNLEVIADLGDGRRTVAFSRMEQQETEIGGSTSVKVWLYGQPTGNHTYTFQADHKWTIQNVSGNELTLQSSGGRYFAALTLNTSVTFVQGQVYSDWTNLYAGTPGYERTNTVELDIFAPNGLAVINDNGSLSSRAVVVNFQAHDRDTGTVRDFVRTYSDATLDGIGFTERLTLPMGRYSWRVRRTNASSTETNIRDDIYWYGLKSRLSTRSSYPRWTTMAVRMRSGGKIAAQSENKINLIATRILPTLHPDGSWGAAQPTRDISAFVRYIARSIGYTDENIDMAELQRLHALWSGRGETFDFIFDLTTVKEALSLSMGAGMAELTIADGLIRPVRERVRTQFEQSYSPQNMTKPLSRTFRARRHDDPDGVEVEYTDGETWTQQTIICALSGSQHLKLEKMRVYGVTDRTRAWRIGMRRIRELAYQRWEYSFDTEMDALNSEYGGYVALFDDVPGYGQSALLQHIAPVSGGVVLHVSEPLDWEEGKEHVVAYRRPDGTLAGPWPATPGPDEFSLIAPIPNGQRPVVSLKLELPHVYFGTAERWTFPALIRQISPNGMEAASVSAVNYDERIYADDDGEPG